MSKKIEDALADLIAALGKHAEVASASHVSLKKSQRAAVKLQVTATAYAAAVYAKSGLDSPFSEVVRPGLEATTLASLEAERDEMVSRKVPAKNTPAL